MFLDQILEAQTVAKALHKGGHTTTAYVGGSNIFGVPLIVPAFLGALVPQAHQAVNDPLNHHSNMAFVDSDVNRVVSKYTYLCPEKLSHRARNPSRNLD